MSPFGLGEALVDCEKERDQLADRVRQLEADAARTPRETPDLWRCQHGTFAGLAAWMLHAASESHGAMPERARETPAGAVEALTAARALAAAWHHEACKLRAVASRSCHWWPQHLASAERMCAALTASGYSLTRSVDVERWQRIETAARAAVAANWSPVNARRRLPVALAALRDAIGSERWQPTDAERVADLELSNDEPVR